MAGNFIQGAMQNALSIQADPTRAMGVAQSAFASSGNLALKLTALIDAEEKQVHDAMIQDQEMTFKNLQLQTNDENTDNALAEQIRNNDLVDTAKTNQRTMMAGVYKANNLVAKRNATTAENNYNLTNSKFDYEKNKDKGVINAPILDLDTQDALGTPEDFNQINDVLKLDLNEEEQAGVQESISTLATNGPVHSKSIPELQQTYQNGLAKIDESGATDGEKVGLRLELKRQVKEGVDTLKLESKAQTELATFAKKEIIKQKTKAAYNPTVASKKAVKELQDDINVASVAKVTKEEFKDNKISDSMNIAFPKFSNDRKRSYYNSFVKEMRNKNGPNGISQEAAVQTAITLVQDGYVKPEEVGQLVEGKYGAGSGNFKKIITNMAKPAVKYSDAEKIYEEQDTALESVHDTNKQYGWFDDLFSLTNWGKEEYSVTDYQKSMEFEKALSGTETFKQAPTYAQEITDEYIQRDTLDSDRLFKSLGEIFDYKVTGKHKEIIEDYAELIELSNDTKSMRKDMNSAETSEGLIPRAFNVKPLARLDKLAEKYPDFVRKNEDGTYSPQPIMVVAKSLGSIDSKGKPRKPIDMTNKFKQIARQPGGPKTRAERDFIGFMFMMTIGNKSGGKNTSAKLQDAAMVPADYAAEKIFGKE